MSPKCDPLSNRHQVSLVGFDIIVSRTQELLVVDANYFPGNLTVPPDAVEALALLVRERAKNVDVHTCDPPRVRNANHILYECTSTGLHAGGSG